MSSAVPTMSDLIRRLFDEVVNPETGKRFTDLEVAIASRGAITPSHLHSLRSGRIQNPTRETLLRLCEVFRKDPRYFFPELREHNDLTLD
jgi:transcriptional regulator with XRE-family HTH domain